MDEELTSVKEVVDLSPPQALDRAERFLMGQGYAAVHRTATTLTAEREGPEDLTGHGGAPKVVAVPQPDGEVRIKVRSDDREGVQERRGLWKLWTENLPKRRL